VPHEQLIKDCLDPNKQDLRLTNVHAAHPPRRRRGPKKSGASSSRISPNAFRSTPATLQVKVEGHSPSGRWNWGRSTCGATGTRSIVSEGRRRGYATGVQRDRGP
jgi:hypothetical protein